jgi:tripartite-type tricarboxylate transporter receptor subunit TctC
MKPAHPRRCPHFNRRYYALAIAIASLLPFEAHGQAYPSRPITVIVPFPAGGPSDVVARIVTDDVSRRLGQAIVIENVGGGGGTLGSARVAAAKPDGYTLLAAAMGSHVSAPVLTPNVKYDPVRDFEPIGFTAQAPAVIVARKDFPAKDLREFVDYLRKNGENVRQAHGGIGSSSHMACLLFASAAGLRPSLVPYRGTGPAMNDLMGGHVDYFCDQAVSVASQVSTGTIKAYATSSTERLAVLPDVPTAKEAGVDYQMSIWAGIFAPRGTPAAIIDRFASALDSTLDDPSIVKRLADLGGVPPTRNERSPAKFGSFVQAEIAHWAPILKAADAASNAP